MGAFMFSLLLAGQIVPVTSWQFEREPGVCRGWVTHDNDGATEHTVLTLRTTSDGKQAVVFAVKVEAKHQTQESWARWVKDYGRLYVMNFTREGGNPLGDRSGVVESFGTTTGPIGEVHWWLPRNEAIAKMRGKQLVRIADRSTPNGWAWRQYKMNFNEFLAGCS